MQEDSMRKPLSSKITFLDDKARSNLNVLANVVTVVGLVILFGAFVNGQTGYLAWKQSIGESLVDILDEEIAAIRAVQNNTSPEQLSLLSRQFSVHVDQVENLVAAAVSYDPPAFQEQEHAKLIRFLHRSQMVQAWTLLCYEDLAANIHEPISCTKALQEYADFNKWAKAYS